MAEQRELAVVLKLVADQYQNELKKSGGLTAEFTKFIRDWRTQIAAASTVLVSLVKSTANYGDELAKMSQRLGTSIEDTARLQHAANLSDASLMQLSATVGFLSQRMYDAQQGSKEAQAGFAALGISVAGPNGQLKGTTEILLEMSDKFRAMPDGVEKTALAMENLGRSGKEALPLLNSNLREAFEEADRLGLVMDTKTAQAAERFNDEITKLQGALRGLMIQGTTPLIESFTELAEGLRGLTQSDAAQFFFRGLSEQAVLFSTLIKEIGANLEFVFGDLTFDKLKTRIAQIEAEAHAKLLRLENPEAGRIADQLSGEEPVISVSARVTGVRPGGGANEGRRQEQLGKALVEIFQTQQRAIEMRNRAEQDGANEYFLAFDRKQLYAQIEADKQEELGRLIVERTQMEVRIREQAAAEAGALQEQLGRQIVEQTQLELRLAEQRRLANRSFFEGWTDGMRRYMADTESGFGLAADMARRTAQTMESGFRTFFFDMMEGRVKSLKDVFSGMLQFVKQIIAQITAQLVATQTLKLVTAGIGALSGGAAGATTGATSVSTQTIAGFGYYSHGGPVHGFGNRDTVPAMLTPGEYVLSRQDVAELKRGGTRGGSPTINITINSGGGRQETSSGAAPNWAQMARELGKLVEAKLIDEQRPGGLLAGGRA